MGDRARVANVVEIEGTLYAQVECVETGRTGEYLGAVPLKRIPKDRQVLLLKGLRDFLLGRAKEALHARPKSDHAKILGALSVLIGKVPTILRDRLPEITVFGKVVGNLFGFAFYAPEKGRNLLALYQTFATDKSVSGMAFLLEMEKFLMETGILQLNSPAESVLQISVNIRGRGTGTAFTLSRKSSRQVLNRGARRNRRNKAAYQYWLLRALNRELFPNEDRTFLQRVTQEEDTLQRESLVEDFLQEMGVEPVPAPAPEPEESPLVLTELEGDAMVSALQEESFGETLEKEETFETALRQIVENAIKRLHGDLKRHYEKRDMDAFLNELKGLMTTRENAQSAVPLLRILLKETASEDGARDHVTEFLIGYLLSRASLGQPKLYEDAAAFLQEIKNKDGFLTEAELLLLLRIHGEAYSRLGLFLEDLFAEVDAIDALSALRKAMKSMVSEGLYRGSKSYERALGLLKPVALKLDQSESLEEGVWFILEEGFKDQAAAAAEAAANPGSQDVIEDAPPMEADQSFIDEDILKTMIASSRFSHLSKQELMAKMSSAGGLRG